jgi:hypothetical protein
LFLIQRFSGQDKPTGMMANLVAKSGDNKGQLTTLAKATARISASIT